MENIRAEIQKSLSQNGRAESELVLLGVSKKQPLEKVIALFNHGITSFGENYVQEGIEKIKLLPSDVRYKTEWHMIGALQSNKAKLVAEYFDWVQTITGFKLAEKLNRLRLDLKIDKPLNVCIQVNIDGSDVKNGAPVDQEALVKLVEQINELPLIQVRGLMIMPDAADDELVKQLFKKARLLFNAIKESISGENRAYFDTLSMGMSGDFQSAIAEGATMIRLGTALFGERHHNLK